MQKEKKGTPSRVLVLGHLPFNEMLSPIAPFGDPRPERIGVNTFSLYQSLARKMTESQ
jgi:hypothetical protein